MNTTTKTQFKVGDKCFYDFKESEILEITEEGIITHIKENGLFHVSGYDLKCFPADIPDIVVFSKFVSELKDSIYELKFNSLNMPDIHRTFVELWEMGCQAILDNNSGVLKLATNRIEDLTNSIVDSVNKLKDETIMGIYLFKR